MKKMRCGVLLAAIVLMNSVVARGADAIIQDFGALSGKDSIVEGSQGGVVSDTMLIPRVEGVYKTYAKVGYASILVGGAVYVENNGNNPLGSTGAYCRGVAATTGASAKISPIVNYAGSAEFYTSFKVIFGVNGGSDTGKWQFGQGKNLETTYSQFNMGYAVGTQGFAVIMFSLATDDSVRISYRRTTGTSSSATTGLTRRILKQGVVYTIEIVGNNRDGIDVNYEYGGEQRVLPPQKFDLYVNGELIGSNLTAASHSTNMRVGDEINSISFDGTNSPNGAAIFLDDIKTYAVVPDVIPVNNGNEENNNSEEDNDEDNSTAAPDERFTELKVYPNPVCNGQLVIAGGQTVEQENVEVYNVLGELVGVYSANDGLTVINLSALPDGLYFVRAGGKSTKVVKR
jgi:hypothetical protein